MLTPTRARCYTWLALAAYGARWHATGDAPSLRSTSQHQDQWTPLERGAAAPGTQLTVSSWQEVGGGKGPGSTVSEVEAVWEGALRELAHSRAGIH